MNELLTDPRAGHSGRRRGWRGLAAIGLRLLPWIAFLLASVAFLRLRDTLERVSVDLPLLALATVLMLAAMGLRGLLWWRALGRFGLRAGPLLAVAAEMRSLLLKFVPGKLWVVVGRAAEISQRGHGSLARTSAVSLFAQLLVVASGLALGGLGALFVDLEPVRRWVLPLAIVLAALLVATSLAPSRALALVPRRLRRGLEARLGFIPGPMPDLLTLAWLSWGLLGLAHCALFAALGAGAGWAPLLLQPLANTLGIVAVFAPGGLGVREGVTMAYLAEAGLALPAATEFTILARFWVVGTELLAFLVGTALLRRHPRPAADPVGDDG